MQIIIQAYYFLIFSGYMYIISLVCEKKLQTWNYIDPCVYDCIDMYRDIYW